MTGQFGHTTCLASSAKYSKTTHRVKFGSSARLNALWADKNHRVIENMGKWREGLFSHSGRK